MKDKTKLIIYLIIISSIGLVLGILFGYITGIASSALGIVEFENKNIVLRDFGKYLTEAKVPGKKTTYYEELLPKDTTPEDYEKGKEILQTSLFNEKEFMQNIDTSKTYHIIFTYFSHREWSKFQGWLQGTGGKVAGV